jgi:hypothetical protein
MKWQIVLSSNLIVFLILNNYAAAIHIESDYLIYNHSRSLINNSKTKNINENRNFLSHKIKYGNMQNNSFDQYMNLTLTEYLNKGIEIKKKEIKKEEKHKKENINEQLIINKAVNTGLSLFTLGLLMSIFVGLIILMYLKIRNRDKLNN